jgi:ABC-type transport system involved in multi-copper enzyme maturation permease subunit
MKKTFVVAKYTFIEVYRSKVMVSLLFLAIGLLGITYIASEFAYGAPAKIALDFGLGIMSISNLIMAIFIGATLLSKEIEQRTLYMILSRPISRSGFLLGKILGLSLVLLINTIVLSSLTIGIYIFLDGVYNSLFIWAAYFAFVEALIVLLFAVLFSLLTNTAMSVVYTMGVFITGHAINEASKIFFAKASTVFSTILDAAFIVIPGFYKLNLKDFVIYQQHVETTFLVNTHIYIGLYLCALVFLISFIFKRKNLD